METKIDARGMACPKPVILTKKAMDNGRKRRGNLRACG